MQTSPAGLDLAKVKKNDEVESESGG